ncbi:MAG: NUDIX domain-containing protein, partial [Planctomycetota bacterium]|nr:NUDIX domain-containing protein [Planctomycetota bacterium]
RFPNVADLAAADEHDVLQLWEGLGYYSRARNLRRAAQSIVEHHAGVFPNDVARLQELPGIGRYTAGAILSFAFDKPAPIVEANTLRLYCRLLGYGTDPRSAEGQRVLWKFAEELVPRDQPGEINQALMELGATVCTPVNPACDDCPLATFCAAKEQGTVAEIPLPAKRPEITELAEVAVVLARGDQFLLMRRKPGERWAGLWDFLRFTEHDAVGGLERHLRDRFGLKSKLGLEFHTLKHSVTRYRITLRCVRANWVAGEPVEKDREFRWVSLNELSEMPLPVTGRKIARLLANHAAKNHGST